MKRKPAHVPAPAIGATTGPAPDSRPSRPGAGPSAGHTADAPTWLQPHADGLRLRVHVQPGARRSAVVGPHGDRLKLALQAPPVDGKANAALCTLVAELLDLPARAVTLVAGPAQRDKTLALAGVGSSAAEAAAVATRLLAACRDGR